MIALGIQRRARRMLSAIAAHIACLYAIAGIGLVLAVMYLVLAIPMGIAWMAHELEHREDLGIQIILSAAAAAILAAVVFA